MTLKEIFVVVSFSFLRLLSSLFYQKMVIADAVSRQDFPIF